MKARIIDFTPMQEREDVIPEYIREGWYDIEIVDVEEGTSSYSGFFYYRWKLKVEGVHTDFRLWYVTAITDRALERFADFLEIMQGERPTGKISFSPRSLIGTKAKAQVKVHRFRSGQYEQEDKLRNEIIQFGKRGSQ